MQKKRQKQSACLYGHQIDTSLVTVQKTRPEFEGDLTLVIFPLTRYSGKSPEETGKELGNWLLQNISQVTFFNVVKGFLNLVISDDFWLEFFRENLHQFDITVLFLKMIILLLLLSIHLQIPINLSPGPYPE